MDFQNLNVHVFYFFFNFSQNKTRFIFEIVIFCKLSEALDDTEQHRQIINQWKRKLQRATQELNDLRYTLEEQTARNAALEKKQRK